MTEVEICPIVTFLQGKPGKTMKPYKLDLEDGEVLAIIGAKGSGKSTFCRMLTGNQESTENTFRDIYINENLANSPKSELSKKIYLFTVSCTEYLVPNLTVAENIFLGRQAKSPLSRINWNKLYSEAKDILEEMGISSIKFDDVCNNLSLLQKIMVVICRQYSRGIQYFIFDEITRDITLGEIETFFRILKNLKKLKKNIIFVPYLIEEITRVADKVSILYKGDFTSEAVKLSDISYERIINIMMGQEQCTNPFTDVFLEKYKITEREKEIIVLIANGFSNQDISDRLAISLGTVKNHIYNLFLKTKVKNRMELCNLFKIK